VTIVKSNRTAHAPGSDVLLRDHTMDQFRGVCLRWRSKPGARTQ
jgi:hypothetical protein